MLAQNKPGLRHSHRPRLYDFIGTFLLQETILMDTGFVGKGVGPDNGLIRLDSYSCNLCQKL